jgi:hypothetical protein
LYEAGFCGAYRDEEARAKLWDTVQSRGGHRSAEDTMTAAGLAGSGKGKLSLPFLAAAHLFPNCYPSAAQERGDCVSHGGAGSALITIANEIWRGIPDKASGIVEGVPELPAQGRTEGVISSAYLWWCRRSGGDGWDCASVVEAMIKEGVMLMKPYSDLGIDLTDYSHAATAKYATKGPTAAMLAESKQHIIRDATEVDSAEAEADLMHNGFGIVDCGGEAWTSDTDENGVAKRSGSWSHSMKRGAFDDRDETKSKYGGPLTLIINNWGEWNSSKSRDIRDSAKYVPPSLKKLWESIDIVNPATGNIMRPRGSFWVKYAEVRNRYTVAMSGASGWKGQDEWLAI